MSSAANVIERFMAGPVGQRLEAEARADLYSRRAVLVQEIAQERRKLEDAAKLDAEIAAAESAVEAARSQVDCALHVLREATRKKLSAIFEADNAIAACERELRASAEPVIDEFIRELNRMDEETRAEFVSKDCAHCRSCERSEDLQPISHI